MDFHPPAPPITGQDGSVEDAHDVIRFDSNFYVAKKTDAGDVRQVGIETFLPRPFCHYGYYVAMAKEISHMWIIFFPSGWRHCT